ncbi:hypothetical protein Taro_006010 [Colocasia esculenta]|uniref:Uncharacterized protein n=1 Tax=Colocasia esculenta TaxID=4460 RepID=A0A843TPY0_COLES|nr:hypothetical protein [Colocasia esculenta]
MQDHRRYFSFHQRFLLSNSMEQWIKQHVQMIVEDVHPDSVCKKLGPKYSTIPAGDLKNSPDFYNDLLSEEELGVYLVEALYCLLSNRCVCLASDGQMALWHSIVRDVKRNASCPSSCLPVMQDCSGLKWEAAGVPTAQSFTKGEVSLGSAFEKSLRARLQKMNPNTDYHCLSVFGSYFNRDIPLPVGTTINFRRTLDGQFITERAFFDMYIGDVPVSMQAKEEVAENVADLIRRC